MIRLRIKNFAMHVCRIALASALLTVKGCSADPDLGEAPGTCTLDCADAKIASSEMYIRTLRDDQDEIEVNCQNIEADQPYLGPVPLRFKVERKERNLPAAKIPDPDGGEAPLGKYDNAIGSPVGHVSFEALIVTGWTADENNPEDDRYKYKGIITPKSEWCTDSCGVGTVDILPLCKASNNDIEVLIHSGPLSRLLKISVKKD